MTWLKLSDDFPDECARAQLSDSAFRTHVEALCWVMRRETGGRLDGVDLRRCIETADWQAAVDELVAAGFWMVADNGWEVVQAMADQPSPERLKAQRDAARDRQQRHRSNATGHAVTDGVTRDGTGKSSSSTRTDPRHGVTDGVTERVTTSAECTTCTPRGLVARTDGPGFDPCPNGCQPRRTDRTPQHRDADVLGAIIREADRRSA